MKKHQYLQPKYFIAAGAVRDAVGVDHRPGFIAVDNEQVRAVGSRSQVRDAVANDRGFRESPVIDLPEHLVMPAMVNAHAHLDLTSLGPWPYDGSFPDWLGMVIKHAPREPQAVADAVRQGVTMSLVSGVIAVGDIARTEASVNVLTHQATGEVALGGTTSLGGVSFLERFGLSDSADEAMAKLPNAWREIARDRGAAHLVRDVGGVRLGIQPHAPYSAGKGVYEMAATSGLPTSTHLAETLDEIAMIQDGEGAIADMIKAMGKWPRDFRPTGLHPIDYLADALGHAGSNRKDLSGWLLAHCNYVTEQHIQQFATWGASVAYCPVASDYFGHRDHAYRKMLAAGVNVCLGTDSIICQPADEPQPMSILAQMRHLHRRDQTDPALLLAMATINGHRALGQDGLGTLEQPGRLVAVRFNPGDSTDPLRQVLHSREPIGPVDALC